MSDEVLALAKRNRKLAQVLDLRFVWPSTCVDLHRIATYFGRAQIWTPIDASCYRLATQRKSTQVDRK